MIIMKALDFLSNKGLGIGLIDKDKGGLQQPPGLRSGGLRLEDPPAGGLRPGPDRIPSNRSGSCSRYLMMIPKCDISSLRVALRFYQNSDIAFYIF